MSSSWIKIRTDLHTDPKVIEMARRLEYMTNAEPDKAVTFVTIQRVTCHNWRHVIVGCLCQLWGVLRQRGKREGDDLVLKNATLNTIDDIVLLDGFGDAVEHVGWVVELDEDHFKSLIFYNFFSEYNSDPNDDRRTKDAERKRRQRERERSRDTPVTESQHSHGTVTPNCHTEKRRVEKNNKYNARDELLALGVPDELINDWLEVRKAKRAPLTKTVIAKLAREAEKAGISVAEAVRLCCERNWQGFDAKWLDNLSQQKVTAKPTPIADRLL